MTEQITNHTKHERTATIQLGYAGTNAQSVVPAILEALNGTNFIAWAEVAFAMKRIGAPKEVVLPRLKEKLKSPEPEARVRMAAGILALVPDDPEALAVLKELIESD